MKRIVFVLALVTCTGCTPQMHNTTLTIPKSDFAPEIKDRYFTDAEMESFSKSVSGLRDTVSTWNTEEFFEVTADFGRAGGEKFLNTSLSLGKAFWKGRGTTGMIRPERLPYIDLAFSQTQGILKKFIDEREKEIRSDIAKINTVLVPGSFTALQNPSRITFLGLGLVLRNFLETLPETFRQAGVSRAVIDGYRARYGEDFRGRLEKFDKKLEAISAAEKDLSRRISLMREALAVIQAGPSVIAEASKEFESGESFHRKIRGATTQLALINVIVDVWEYLDDAQRRSYFAAADQGLYDFLNELTPAQRLCIRQSTCYDTYAAWGKTYYFRGAILSFGFEEIKTMMVNAISKYALTRFHAQTLKALADAPAIVRDIILEELRIKGLASIAKARRNLSNDFRALASDWVKNRIFGGHTSAPFQEVDKVEISYGPSKPLTVRAASGARPSASGTWGSLIAYQSLPWAVGASALSSRIDEDHFLHLNRLLFAGGLDRAGLQGDPEFKLPISSTLSRARLIRGLIQASQSLADWKSLSFDRGLGAITAASVRSDLGSEASRLKIFPKEKFFELTMFLLTSAVSTLEGSDSGLMLFDEKLSLISDESRAVSAAFVDRADGALQVRALDQAEWILALAEFIDFTNELESVKSVKVREGLDRLRKASGRMKLLILALGNFLSSQLVQPDGSVVPLAVLTDGTWKPSGPPLLRDQMKSAQAFGQVYKRFDLAVYQWAAQSALAYCNRVLWNDDLGFYALVESSPLVADGPHIGMLVDSLSKTKNILSEKSRVQVEKMLSKIEGAIP